MSEPAATTPGLVRGGLPEWIVEARQFLQDRRQELRALHEQGMAGVEVCELWTVAMATVVQGIYEEALADPQLPAAHLLPQRVALVAHGGFGRQDLAPYSDVDLLLLYHPAVRSHIPPLARRLFADFSDVGLQPGFNARTTREACDIAWQDITVFTSQSEARYLIGSATVFSGFMREFRRGTERRAPNLIHRIRQARKDERSPTGDTVFLLQPNIKRSRGGLREIHLLRWIGFARYLQRNPQQLERHGLIGPHDWRAIREAYEFLLRLRNEMHFQAGRSQDVLSRPEQIRIAEKWGYPGTAGLLPVEQFMRDYFAHTNDLRHAVENFVESTYNPTLVQTVITQLTTHRFDKHFLIGSVHINVTKKGISQLLIDLSEILRLMELANVSEKRIGPETWHAIRDALAARTDWEITPEVARRFLNLLAHPTRLGGLLRRLHELRLLEKLIVGLDHARHLVQFNEYHKYTVDEHCILAVEKATEFAEHSGALGAAYRSITDPRILHLALLIHDVGKGYPEDHSEVGRKLALHTAQRLYLDAAETQLLEFLVHKHLMMAHLAFRRDISDERAVVKFAAEVGSPEYLRALFVLTAADLASVGPDVLTPWKLEFLSELYLRAQNYLEGTHEYSGQRAEAIRQQVLEQTPADDPRWYEIQVGSLPDAYVLENRPAEIVGDLLKLRELIRHPVLAWGRYSAERDVSIYSLGFRAGRARGTFHRMAAAFSEQGINILSACIYTLANQAVLARIYVNDADFPGEPPATRFEEMSTALMDAIQATQQQPPTLRARWQDAWRKKRAELDLLPTRVLIDQSSRRDVTILDIFTHDRLGLLYTIARTLFDLQLLVHFAKITTHLDQVLSVFYVTDAQRNKILDEARWEEIRKTIIERIEAD